MLRCSIVYLASHGAIITIFSHYRVYLSLRNVVAARPPPTCTFTARFFMTANLCDDPLETDRTRVVAGDGSRHFGVERSHTALDVNSVKQLYGGNASISTRELVIIIIT